MGQQNVPKPLLLRRTHRLHEHARQPLRAGYVAAGDRWSVVIKHPDKKVTNYSSSNGAHHVCDAVIGEGDVVTVRAAGTSTALAGNPVPAATDFLPTATGKCLA